MRNGEPHVYGRAVEDDHQPGYEHEQQPPPAARMGICAMPAQHAVGGANLVAVPTAGTVVLAVGLIAVIAVAVVLAVPVKAGDVLAEGAVVMYVEPVDVRSSVGRGGGGHVRQLRRAWVGQHRGSILIEGLGQSS